MTKIKMIDNVSIKVDVENWIASLLHLLKMGAHTP